MKEGLDILEDDDEQKAAFEAAKEKSGGRSLQAAHEGSP